MSAPERLCCSTGAWGAAARRWVLPWALQGRRPAGDVLELGSGTGAMAAGLAHRFPQARMTATDLDPRMVAVAARRHAGLRTEVADSTALPYGDASYDVVVSFLMLHHVVAWEQAVTEVARVLRPGGLFLGYDLTDTRVARVVHRLDGSPHRLLRGDELGSALTTAGFAEVTLRWSAARHLFRFVARR